MSTSKPDKIHRSSKGVSKQPAKEFDIEVFTKACWDGQLEVGQ